MDTSNLEQLRECCKNEKMYLVIYDGGTAPDLPILVCKNCFENDPAFQQFIKKKTLLSETVTNL